MYYEKKNTNDIQTEIDKYNVVFIDYTIAVNIFTKL